MKRNLLIGCIVGVSSAIGCSADRGEQTLDNSSDAIERREERDSLRITELRRRTTFLAADERQGRDEGSPGSIAARAFIVKELEACGVKPAGVGGSFEQPITTGIGANVLGVIPGTDRRRARRHVIVSAHYDHLGVVDGEIHNGAQDNAASVASVLAVACATAKSPLPRSVLIALWDAEEPPTFLESQMGSEFFAKHPTVPFDSIDAAFVLDLTGGSLWGDEQGHPVMGAELSPEVKAALDAAPVPPGLMLRKQGLHVVEHAPDREHVWSDYEAFRKRRVPVLFFSDGQNARYHTPDDDVDSLDFPKLARETVHLNDVTRALASASSDPTFVANGTDYLRDAVSVQALLYDSLDPIKGIIPALGLGEASTTKLRDDLKAVSEVLGRLADGAEASPDDVKAIRTGAQRVMCLASGERPATCHKF
jgi:hypothetical protein